jgi:hypothetical protein
MDLCSGGMIWSCCVDILPQQSQNDDDDSSQPGSLNNASEYLSSCVLFCFHYLRDNESLSLFLALAPKLTFILFINITYTHMSSVSERGDNSNINSGYCIKCEKQFNVCSGLQSEREKENCNTFFPHIFIFS